MAMRTGRRQWCIAKNGGGYTQTGVTKGLKVPCLFMITEVSIRSQKKPGGWYTPYTRVYPPIHHWTSQRDTHDRRRSTSTQPRLKSRAALSIWWALRTSPCRGPNPSVDRRVRWMRRAPGQAGKKLVVTKCLFYSNINIL